jgi:hypothetical protein
LVPGQVLSEEILDFFIKLDVKEIHGYRDDLGLRVFTEAALNRKKTATAMMGTALKNGIPISNNSNNNEVSSKTKATKKKNN